MDFPICFFMILQTQRAPVSIPICSDSLQGISQSVQQQTQQQSQQQQQQPNQQQESLCSEMARELCRALRCHASSRRRRTCEKCSTHVLGYPPDNPTATPLNGMRSQVSNRRWLEFFSKWLISYRIMDFRINFRKK